MIKYIYILSVITLFVISILIKKKEEKTDLVVTFFVGIILFTCYNIVICELLAILNININLLTLAIPNYIISVALLYKIIKTKKIQKYTISTKNILAVSIIIILGLIVSYVIFDFPSFNVPFVQVDASNHYGMITEFYETGKLDSEDIPGAYINYGIVFKIFFKPIEKFDGYNLFIILEIIKLIFSGILFYLALSKCIKGKLAYIIAILLSCIYMLAYPLNGMLCGFVYLQMAVNIVNAIIIVVLNYKQTNNAIKNIELFLLCFGLMFTYYILVPPVYVALFLYELKGFKQNKLRAIKNILAIFLLPCILGFSFYILPGLIDAQNNFSPTSNMASKDAHDAYIFVSYYAMFLFFIPFNIFYVINKIRRKEIDFMSILLVITVLYIILALILKHYNLLARYYCMKPYYMLWLIMLVITGITILELLNKNIEKTYKVLINILFFAYITGVIFATIKGPCSFKIFEREKETINSMFNIYKLNRGIVLHENFEMVYTNKELEVLKDITKQFNDETKLICIEDGLNREWIRRILLIDKFNIDIPMNKNAKEEVEKYLANTEEKVYIICYKNKFINKNFSQLIESLDNNLKTIEKCGKLAIYSNK